MKHLPLIISGSLRHKDQRYETCGDYYKDGKAWIFSISQTNIDYEFLILMHELTEWYLTQKRGIKEKDITKFDLWHLEENLDGEPGNHKDAPYRKEHQFATKIEKLICKELGINWYKYDKIIDSL